MALLNPHFDLPLRVSGNSFACVEQDSFEDIANCVEVIVRTPQGERDDAPDFGLPDQEFDIQPLSADNISAIVAAQEPRASLVISSETDFLDNLIARIGVEVSS